MGEGMRQCKCGGVIREAELTQNRQSWRCDSCNRYEIFRPEQEPAEERKEQSEMFALERNIPEEAA